MTQHTTSTRSVGEFDLRRMTLQRCGDDAIPEIMLPASDPQVLPSDDRRWDGGWSPRLRVQLTQMAEAMC